jgi:hypothetical protein
VEVTATGATINRYASKMAYLLSLSGGIHGVVMLKDDYSVTTNAGGVVTPGLATTADYYTNGVLSKCFPVPFPDMPEFLSYRVNG